jgi:hypothetical protein
VPARIELTPDALIVHMEGADKLWALKSRLEIPLRHVVGARPAVDEARSFSRGLKVAGTALPGVITAGRFYSQGELVFWDVHQAAKAIAIGLRDERYSRLVLEVENPEAEITRIDRAAAAAAG